MSVLHEDLAGRESVRGSSDRAFGLVFSTVFALVGGYRLWAGRALGAWLLGLAALLLVVALVAPHRLARANQAWFRLGMLLHRITSPVVLGLLYFGCVVPIGLLLRLAGKDPLRLRFDASAETYWIVRQPPGPAPETMRHQF